MGRRRSLWGASLPGCPHPPTSSGTSSGEEARCSGDQVVQHPERLPHLWVVRAEACHFTLGTPVPCPLTKWCPEFLLALRLTTIRALSKHKLNLGGMRVGDTRPPSLPLPGCWLCPPLIPNLVGRPTPATESHTKGASRQLPTVAAWAPAGEDPAAAALPSRPLSITPGEALLSTRKPSS